MELFNCIKGRRSVRSFKDKTVDRATIERIVSLASYAPSWKNTQTLRYIIVENEEIKSTIASHGAKQHPNNGRIINNAPAVIVEASVRCRSGYERDGTFTTIKGEGWEMFDAGIAAQTLCLAAFNEGLGTLIMGIFDENEIASIIGLPETQRVSALIAIGYPGEEPDMPKRKALSELLRFI